LDIALCLLGDGDHGIGVDNFVFESTAFRDETKLKFLLLLFHFFITLQENLCDFWESLFDCHLSEFGLLDFISGNLLASPRSASIILEAGTRWLNHIELESLHGIMVGKDQRSSEWSVRRIDGAHLELHGNSISKNGSWASDTEHALILVGLFSSSLDDRSSVWYDSVNDSSGVHINSIESLIGTVEHHLVNDDLLCS
jgi:hypothetical protein